MVLKYSENRFSLVLNLEIQFEFNQIISLQNHSILDMEIECFNSHISIPLTRSEIPLRGLPGCGALYFNYYI